MLELDLDLEADLGIDTVKQAEVFARVREEYGIPRQDDLKLRDYPTLGHVIEFVRKMRPDLATARAPEPAVGPAASPGGDARAGPRPRGRPRHRHRQAGGGVRHGAGGLRDPAPGRPQAARLPD